MSLTEQQLQEAREELDRRECDLRGHVWVHLVDGTGELLRVLCDRCPKSWSVVAG